MRNAGADPFLNQITKAVLSMLLKFALLQYQLIPILEIYVFEQCKMTSIKVIDVNNLWSTFVTVIDVTNLQSVLWA